MGLLLVKVQAISVGAPATVVIVPTLATDANADDPIAAETVVASPAWLLGWNTVVATPEESVEAVPGEKLNTVPAK